MVLWSRGRSSFCALISAALLLICVSTSSAITVTIGDSCSEPHFSDVGGADRWENIMAGVKALVDSGVKDSADDEERVKRFFGDTSTTTVQEKFTNLAEFMEATQELTIHCGMNGKAVSADGVDFTCEPNKLSLAYAHASGHVCLCQKLFDQMKEKKVTDGISGWNHIPLPGVILHAITHYTDTLNTQDSIRGLGVIEGPAAVCKLAKNDGFGASQLAETFRLFAISAHLRSYPPECEDGKGDLSSTSSLTGETGSGSVSETNELTQVSENSQTGSLSQMDSSTSDESLEFDSPTEKPTRAPAPKSTPKSSFQRNTPTKGSMKQSKTGRAAPPKRKNSQTAGRQPATNGRLSSPKSNRKNNQASRGSPKQLLKGTSKTGGRYPNRRPETRGLSESRGRGSGKTNQRPGKANNRSFNNKKWGGNKRK